MQDMSDKYAIYDPDNKIGAMRLALIDFLAGFTKKALVQTA